VKLCKKQPLEQKKTVVQATIHFTKQSNVEMDNNNNQNRILTVEEGYMLQLGIEFGGFRVVQEKTNKHRFRMLYGVDPKSASECFLDLQTKDIDNDKKIQNINPIYFLMTLYWLYGYGTATTVSGAFRVKAENTFRKHGWEYLGAIQALAAHKASGAKYRFSSLESQLNCYFFILRLCAVMMKTTIQ
jgi:hypothetical protein